MRPPCSFPGLPLPSDVQRKNGLIIYCGPPPTREMKQKWKKAANDRSETHHLCDRGVCVIVARIESPLRLTLRMIT